MNSVAWIWHPASSSSQNPHLGATTPPSKPSTMAQDPQTLLLPMLCRLHPNYQTMSCGNL